MSKQPPPAPTVNAVGPCPTIIQISRTPQHWKFTQHHHTTRHPPPPPKPHLLSPLIMVDLKMTYLEIFQSNIVKYTTNRYVDCNAVSWFSICSLTRQDSCTIPFLILIIFVALCLHWRSIDFTHSSVNHLGLRGQFCSFFF